MNSRILIFFFSFLYVAVLIGQNPILRTEEHASNKERPKVALVLSGGAAHGLAHVGVIKFLEENDIPIDIVTGTSMGAIVGALYSLGYSTKEMDEIVSRYNWTDIITNHIELVELSPYEKQFHEKIPFSLRVEKSRLLLPKAIFEGYKLDQKLFEIFTPAFLVDDFSTLPRPFACYSVDILSGKVVEHNSGSLSRAVRASMAIPSIFTPVVMDSMLLIDGGILKNFPVKEARAMGADIIIGVYVGSNRGKMEEVQSMADIIKLTGFLTSLNDTQEQKNECDLLIEPNVKDMPVLGFQNYNDLKVAGYNKAQEHYKDIERIKNFLSQYKKKPPLQPYIIPSKVFFEDVRIKRKYKIYDEIIENSFNQIENNAIGLQEYNGVIEDVFSTNNLENLNTKLIEGSFGHIMEVDYQVKKDNSVGLTISHFDNTSSSLILSGAIRNLLYPLTIARGFVRLGNKPAVSGQLYKRMGKQHRILWGVEGLINRFADPIYIDDQRIELSTINHYKFAGKWIWERSRNSKVSISYALHRKDLKLQNQNQIGLTDFDFSMQEFYIDYQINTLNRWAFPTYGGYIRLGGSLMHKIERNVQVADGMSSDHIGIPDNKRNQKLEFVSEYYKQLYGPVIAESGLSVGLFSSDMLAEYFRIGGSRTYAYDMLPMIGANQGEYRLQQYLYARQAIRIDLSPKFNLAMVANFLRGQTFYTTFMDADKSPEWISQWTFGGSIGINTIIGPLHFDVGVKEGSRDISFSIGVGFRHIF